MFTAFLGKKLVKTDKSTYNQHITFIIFKLDSFHIFLIFTFSFFFKIEIKGVRWTSPFY